MQLKNLQKVSMHMAPVLIVSPNPSNQGLKTYMIKKVPQLLLVSFLIACKCNVVFGQYCTYQGSL